MEKCNQEESIREIKRDVEKLYDKVESMPKIEFIMEQLLTSNERMISSIEDQSKINQDLKITLNQLSFNLEALNVKQEKTDRKITNMEEMIGQNQKRGTINLIDTTTKGIEGFLIKATGGIIGLLAILYAILTKAGVL
jgi:hypothetical protein